MRYDVCCICMKTIDYMTQAEAARVAGVTRVTIERAIRLGALKVVAIGGGRLVTATSLKGWIESRKPKQENGKDGNQ